MALSILHQPTSQAAFKPSAFTVQESSGGIYTNTDFKFIAVVKDGNGVQIAKMKFPIYPNSTNKGVISVSRILETQVTNYFDLDPTGSSAAPIFAYEVEFGKFYGATEYLNEISVTGVCANSIIDTTLDLRIMLGVTERNIHRNELGWVYIDNTNVIDVTDEYQIVYKSYSSAGVLLKTVTFPFTVFLASGKQWKYPLGANTLGVASGQISSGTLPLIDAACSYYTIEMQLKPFGGSFARIGDLFTFNILDTCSDYEGYTLNWLNKLGGFDSWYFQFKREDSYQIQRQQMKRNTWEFNSDVYAENTHKHAITNYITKAKQIIRLNSDNLTTADSQYLQGLATSPEVYLLDGVDYYPVNIVADGYEMKTNQNDSVFNLTVQLEISEFERSQRL